MTITHLHLLMTHVPVLGVLFGFLIMAYAVFKKHNEIKKVAYTMFILSALITVPTYLAGEKSEESVEDLPGVSESIIEEHEDTAKVAASLTYLLGALSLITLFAKLSDKKKKTMMFSVLALSFITSGVMAQTANLGGQIRHSEIRSNDLGTINTEKNEEDEKE